MENTISWTEIWEKARLDILFAGNMIFNLKLIKRDKEDDYIFVKQKCQDGEKIVTDTYAPNITTHNCIKQITMYMKNQMSTNKITIRKLQYPAGTKRQMN